MLARLMKDSEWTTRRYKAHASFDDFGGILWPEQFSPSRLRSIRQSFINQQDAGGYSQEYLNDPLDNEDQYLSKDQFLPMTEEDRDLQKLLVVGVDFAVSKKDSANRTSMTVAGQSLDARIHFVDQRVGRWDSEEIIDELFSLEELWHPDIFFVEGGQIWLAMWPTIKKEMMRRRKFLNFDVRTPVRDKATRGRAYQKRMKARACRFDKEASWYVGFEEENLRFTGSSDATLDDQFDSAALAVLGLESMPDVEDEDFDTEEEIEFRRNDPRASLGRNSVTGY